ncbi:hypothetical protein N7447_005186 [Penicillium robsamsonii]|uniref:uncharacterized protein n=1 Tax=Penicillium robsamsonii TaxID=1792511 RepID=UPI002546A652|nr:uncharacterized protein N7447_005186 [Penicillium robsamsonii]KAJ5822846.1 hypothetical protein N7447_005186 [Penicillium robsamsonii]
MIASSPPNGSDFVSPGLEPDQMIKRRLNPEWDPRNPSRATKRNFYLPLTAMYAKCTPFYCV